MASIHETGRFVKFIMLGSIERELGIGSGNLSRWKQEFAADGEDAFPGYGRLTPEQERLRQLERENEILRQERNILKEAIAIFSERKP